MARFTFRLQRVLEHRRREVEAAKLEVTKAAGLLAEIERRIVALVATAARAAESCGSSVDERLDLQAHLEIVDSEARALDIERTACEEDLVRAKDALLAKRSELGAIEALEEKARAAWQYEESRREQNALDEWATMRRPAESVGAESR